MQITRITLNKNKVHTVWVDDYSVYRGTIENTVEFAKQYSCDSEFEFKFNVYRVPAHSIEHEIKKYVRMASKIAKLLGVKIDKPKQLIINGYLYPKVYIIKAREKENK